MNKEQELQKALQAAQDALTAYQSVKPAVWVPKKNRLFYHVGDAGSLCRAQAGEYVSGDKRIGIGNCYSGYELAQKAAEYSRVQGLINQACLNVESDYVPDWSESKAKWSPIYDANLSEWIPSRSWHSTSSSIHQSTENKAKQVCDILNDINLKLVGVK